MELRNSSVISRDALDSCPNHVLLCVQTICPYTYSFLASTCRLHRCWGLAHWFIWCKGCKAWGKFIKTFKDLSSAQNRSQHLEHPWLQVIGYSRCWSLEHSRMNVQFRHSNLEDSRLRTLEHPRPRDRELLSCKYIRNREDSRRCPFCDPCKRMPSKSCPAIWKNAKSNEPMCINSSSRCVWTVCMLQPGIHSKLVGKRDVLAD